MNLRGVKETVFKSTGEVPPGILLCFFVFYAKQVLVRNLLPCRRLSFGLMPDAEIATNEFTLVHTSARSRSQNPFIYFFLIVDAKLQLNNRTEVYFFQKPVVVFVQYCHDDS